MLIAPFGMKHSSASGQILMASRSHRSQARIQREEKGRTKGRKAKEDHSQKEGRITQDMPKEKE